MKYLSGVLVAVIIIGAVWYGVAMNKGQNNAMDDRNAGVQATTTAPGAQVGVDTNVTEGTVTEIVVNGNNFAFSPKEIRVKEGTRVRVVFNNTGGLHDFVLDEFNARTKQIKGDQSETIEFVASKKGTFEYYCSVGTHRQMGMVGNFIVE